MHRRADRYRSIAIVKGYRTVKILWPTDECRKSSRLYKWENRAIFSHFWRNLLAASTILKGVYLGDPDVPDSQSVYFFLLNSCSARAKLYVYFMRVHAISKSCNCTGRGRRAVEILNRAGRGAHFIHSEKCTCTDSSTDSSRARYFVPVA